MLCVSCGREPSNSCKVAFASPIVTEKRCSYDSANMERRLNSTATPNQAIESTASRRNIQLCMTRISLAAATRALARGSSSWSR
jgi:hypothetical protein